MKHVFKEGDLVCITDIKALNEACITASAPKMIGQIVPVKDLRRYEWVDYFTHMESWSIPTNACKPVVHYIGRPIIVRGRASLYVVDHPELGAAEVETSVVVRHDCGIIETRNTVYIPAGNAKFKKVS
jgi:hypothetical protein